MLRTILATTSAACLAAMPVLAQESGGQAEGDSQLQDQGYAVAARAAVMNRDGAEIGTVTINETRSGTHTIVVALTDIPEGAHGIHLHETGDCSADDFTSAGGHIPGDAEHGVYAENGPHPGDLPNAIVGADGALNVEHFNDLIDIEEMILDDDGAAFIVHAGADDYVTQSAGDSGDRIACGVFEAG